MNAVTDRELSISDYLAKIEQRWKEGELDKAAYQTLVEAKVLKDFMDSLHTAITRDFDAFNASKKGRGA